jgi:hypothetical protein
MPTCRLCLQDRKLIDAHLIPRCMYNHDRKSPMAVVGIIDAPRPKRSQTGFYDKNTLCADCDEKLGILDQYACEICRTENLVLADTLDGPAVDSFGEPVCYVLKNAAPVKLLLFTIAVLWRCHHSCREEALRVNLGSHELKFRQLLLGELSLSETSYTALLEFNSDFELAMIVGKNKRLGLNMNTFNVRRFGFHLKTDQRRLGNNFDNISLHPSKPVYVLSVKRFSTPFGQKIAQGIAKTFARHGTPWANAEPQV